MQGNELTLSTTEIKLIAKDSTKSECKKFLSETEASGSESEGLTRYSNRMIDGPLSAFELLVSNTMLTHIQRCTEAEAHTVKTSDKWKLPLSELKAFISLFYVGGALCGKNRPILEFWDKNGVCLFSRNDGQKLLLRIMRCLRFDMRSI